jgi:hypothetical protein
LAAVVALLSNEVELALRSLGIATNTYVGVVGCDEAVPVLSKLTPPNGLLVYRTVEEAVRGSRTHRLLVHVVGAEIALQLLRALNNDGVTVGCIGHVPEGSSVSSAVLRSFGIMDVVKELSEQALLPLLKRGLEVRALLQLELAHRCESKRLHQRELELLGHPPETMSDDLNTFQPPPLPVGPLSVYNLDEASEAFERAYIDRVQQLCASAREAAVYLGVSSATLSRRLRRENQVHGDEL